MAELKIGAHVEITGKTGKNGKPLQGVVKFAGSTAFAPGKWIGVELQEPEGKNDGTVKGKHYFDCKPNHGMFVRQNQVSLIKEIKAAPKGTSGLARPTTASPQFPPTTDDDDDPGDHRGAKSSNVGIPRYGGGGFTGGDNAISSPRHQPSRLVTPTGGTGLRAPSSRLPMMGSRSSTPSRGIAGAKKSTEDLSKSKKSSEDLPKTTKAGETTKALSKSSSNSSSVSGGKTPSKTQDKAKTANSDKKITKAATPAIDDNKMAELKKVSEKEISAQKVVVQDLEEKVALLSAKNKEKMKEIEKYKLQIAQLNQYKTSWSASQSELHEQVKAAKKEAKESTEAKAKAESELDELRDRVEVMALDKEMAEERAEVAELEKEELEEEKNDILEKYTALTKELESDEGAGVSLDNVKVKQAEIKVEQLKDAVIKLKDLRAQDKKEIDVLTEKLEKEHSQVAELQKLKETLDSEITEYETMVTELTEQVDCAIGAETMVEQLSDKNLELEEKLGTMTEELDFLRELRETSEELEEQMMATERELREELEISRNTQYQLTRKVEEANTQNSDLQHVILQFRSYVNQLQAQMKDMQEQMSEEKQHSETAHVDEEKLAQLALLQTQVVETKTTDKSYDGDFATIDIEDSKEEVRLLKYFFPERFTTPGGDYEALKLLLLLNKLRISCDVVSKVTSSFLKRDEVLSGQSLPQLQLDKALFGAGLVLELGHFKVAVSGFERCIRQCDPDTFLRLGRLSSDLGPHLTNLAAIRGHLEKQSLDESVSVDPLIQSTKAFQNLRTTYFADIQESCREILADNMMIMNLSTEGILVSQQKLASSLTRVQEGAKLSDKTNQIKAICGDILKTIRRIKNFVPADGKPFSFPSDISVMLSNTVDELCKSFKAIATSAVNLSLHVAGVGEDDIITVPDIEDIIKKACAPVGTSGSGFDRIKDHLQSLLPPLQKMASNLQDGDYDQRGDADTKSEPPYQVRSHLFKEQFSLADQLTSQVEFKNNEIFELKKMLRMKGEEISQQAVKSEMLEKRLENARKEGDSKVDNMKKDVVELNKKLEEKDKQFEETMDQLQEDIDALESEKATLKHKLEQANKRAPRSHQYETLLAEQAAGGSGTAVRVIVEDSPATLARLTSVQSYAQVLQEENVKLMANKIKSQLANLPPLNIVSSQPPEIPVAKEVNELHQALLAMVANNKVIDITKTVKGKTPAEVLAEQKATRVCVHNDYLKIKLRAQKEMGRYYNAAGFIKTKSGDFVAPDYSRVLKEKQSTNLYGKITIPSSKNARNYKVLLNPSDLKSLNTELLGFG